MEENNFEPIKNEETPIPQKRKGIGYFIAAIILFVIATAVFIYFAIIAGHTFTTVGTDDSSEALGAAIVIVLLIPLWIISGPVSGIASAVLSGLAIKFSKASIALMAISIFYAVAPFVYILIMNIL